MKIVFLETLHLASYKNKIVGGTIKVCWDQIKYLDSRHDIHIISSQESDIQHRNQRLLSTPWRDVSRAKRAGATIKNTRETASILKELKPDLIINHLGSARKPLYQKYKIDIPTILYQHGKEYGGPQIFNKQNLEDRRKFFDDNKIFWVSVSEKMKRIYHNQCHDTTSIHVIDYEIPLKPREKFGVMINRWDLIKDPHLILNDYFKTGLEYPIKMFLPEPKQWYENRELYRPLKPYLQNPRLEILYNQPREVIFDTLSRGSFFLGTLNESSPIVSTECGAAGIAYISQDRGQEGGVGEKEHLPPESLFVVDGKGPYLERIQNYKKTIRSVVEGDIWSEEQRILSQKLCREKFSPENFLKEQERIINLAMEKYG